MNSESAKLEDRLKSLHVQLSSESEILERIVYKGKNQHRGSLYFQALLKVRRDLRLLQSTKLGQILNALFPIIRGTSSAEHACHSKLSKKNYIGGNHTYHNRLLGVARLLSQMVEPILKAAIQISLLLAKSFFMGFSLTILACLARLRVLAQQALLDVVSVFNMVSAHSQKHSLKLSREGIETFVEYYSTSGDILTLECIWEDDKYTLKEGTQSHNKKIPEEHEAFPLEAPIKYHTLELLGQGTFIEHEDIRLEEATTDSKCIDLHTSSTALRHQSSKSRKRVAFVGVQISKPSETEPNQPGKKMMLNFPSSRNADIATVNDAPFPDFLFGGSQDKSLF